MGPLNLYTQPTACNLKSWLGDFHWSNLLSFMGNSDGAPCCYQSKQLALEKELALTEYRLRLALECTSAVCLNKPYRKEALLQTSFSKPRDKQHELLEKVIRRECLPIQWAQQPPHSAHLVPNWNEGWCNRSSSGSMSLTGRGSYVAIVDIFPLHIVTQKWMLIS